MKRIITAILAMLVVPAAFAAATTTTAANTETTKIEGIIKEYILKNPEVVIEAIQGFQRKQYEEAEKTAKQTQLDAPKFAQPLFHQTNDPVTGDANGTITVVEFFDYQCPHCVDMSKTLELVTQANPNIRFVYKEWPIRGPASEIAARAALAANIQGKYIQFHNALFDSKEQPLTKDIILKIAQTVGLDVEKLKKDMDSSMVSDNLKANLKLAQDLKLFGTPAFFIGKTNETKGSIAYVPGQLSQPQLQEMIDKASK